MMKWRDNKRIAIMMAFDLDAETMWTTRGDGNGDHITNLSRGVYGPKQGVTTGIVHRVKPDPEQRERTIRNINQPIAPYGYELAN